MDRCKNFFALGMCYWLYNRSMEPPSLDRRQIQEQAAAGEANKLAMQAGYSYCEATEAFQISYEIPPAKLAPGVYRNISGNQALAMGFVAASQRLGFRFSSGSYPITPAPTSSRAFHVQGFRRHHVSGRRRNRRHHFRHRRFLRRRSRPSPPLPAPAWR
jgi:hypothetical protein